MAIMNYRLGFADREHIIEAIKECKYRLEQTFHCLIDNRDFELVMHPTTFMILREECELRYGGELDESGTIFGISIKVDASVPMFTFTLRKKERPYNSVMLPFYNLPAEANLPKKIIINDGATILFWEDGSKTIVKKSKEDIYDPIKSFLWAYFQKKCGMSKTKANKYLAEINDKF